MPKWRWRRSAGKTEDGGDGGASHLELAQESLRELVNDTRLPAAIRDSLSQDYAAVAAMLDKLEHGHLHIAANGRVSTGKSSLLNALIGEDRFTVSPLHGETRKASMERWSEIEAGGVFLIDTPGLDEAGGEDREVLAKEVAEKIKARLVLGERPFESEDKQRLPTFEKYARQWLKNNQN